MDLSNLQDFEIALAADATDSQFITEPVPGSNLSSILGNDDLIFEALIPDRTVAPVDALASQLEEEAALLMYYLDHVFPDCFPFYRPSIHSGGRFWLLPLLTTSKAVYYSTLSLAAVHWKMMLRSDDNLDLRRKLETDMLRYRTVASRELQECLRMLDDEGHPKYLRGCVDTLVCVMQLLFIESTSNRTGNWTGYVSIMSRLIPTVMGGPAQRLLAASSSPEGTLAAGYSASSQGAYALKFILHGVMWMEPLCCISLGKPSVFYKHRDILNQSDGEMQQDKVFGCKNWSVALLLETMNLAEWKQQAQAQRNLRARELVKRAVEIEERLEWHIAEELRPAHTFLERLALLSQGTTITESNLSNNGRNTSGSDGADSAQAMFCMTHLFAVATATYLHVVVDGFNPNLPEIRHNLNRAVDAFACLPHVSLLRRLMWPLCLTGCLADPKLDEQRFFKEMLTSAIAIAERDRRQLATAHDCSQALRLLERVWQWRLEGSIEQGELDLVTVMKILGTPLLLV